MKIQQARGGNELSFQNGGLPRVVAVGSAATLLMLLAACAGDGESEVDSVAVEYAQQEAEAQAECEDERDYARSESRSSTITNAANQYGAQVMAAAEAATDEASTGRFEFYNPFTEKWGRGPGNEGWGHLYYTKPKNYSHESIDVSVYQSADGTFDLSKGVMEIGIGFANTHEVVLTSPV